CAQPGVGAPPALNINKPSGTLTLAGTIRTAKAWTYTAGTVDPGTSTVVFAGGTITGSPPPNAGGFHTGATKTGAAGTTLTVNGVLTLTNGFIDTGVVAARGDVNQLSTFDGGTG